MMTRFLYALPPLVFLVLAGLCRPVYFWHHKVFDALVVFLPLLSLAVGTACLSLLIRHQRKADMAVPILVICAAILLLSSTLIGAMEFIETIYFS